MVKEERAHAFIPHLDMPHFYSKMQHLLTSVFVPSESI